MKVLVTGGAGFIASHVVDRLMSEGHSVVVIDNLLYGHRSYLNKHAVFYEMDICSPDLDEVFEKEKPDCVSHHAAQISIIGSIKEPLIDATINIQGSLNVFHLSWKHNVKKVIYASTAGAVYGVPKYFPVDENHPIDPLVPYGLSKYAAERYLILYGARGLRFTILRYSNVYGPRQAPHGTDGVIAVFTQKMLNGEAPIIFGDGSATRDYVYITDIVDANILALDEGDGAIYNLASGIETSVREIFDLLRENIGCSVEPIYEPKRTGEVHRIYFATWLACGELGWSPKVGLAEGIKITTEYFRQLSDSGEERLN